MATNETRIQEHARRTCEDAVQGKYDAEWGTCNPDIKKIIAVTGFGHVRDVTRMSRVLGTSITAKNVVTTGARNAIVRGKGLGFESVFNVPIDTGTYEAWLDTFKIKPELEGKKSSIVTRKVNVPIGGDMMRIYIDINEPVFDAWKKRFKA